jgi:hypothetical protein
MLGNAARYVSRGLVFPLVTSALLVLFLLATPCIARAAYNCAPTGVCSAYLSGQVTPVQQRTAVWCWAASLSALFGFYGHPIDQSKIVTAFFGSPVVRTASGGMLTTALNQTWTDDAGQQFTASAQVTDLYTVPQISAPHQVTNADIVNALTNETPVLYGDYTHVMVLVEADYVPTPSGVPNIVGGVAIDPEPFQLVPGCTVPRMYFCGPGARRLQPGELQATYVGIPISIQ